jgi:hypothetical protein
MFHNSDFHVFQVVKHTVDTRGRCRANTVIKKTFFNGMKITLYNDTICPADNATAGSLGRRRAGQLRFGFVAVSAGHIVCRKRKDMVAQLHRGLLSSEAATVV